MNIDSELSGAKSRGRGAVVSGAGKQNSQRINMSGWGRVCVFISHHQLVPLVGESKESPQMQRRAAGIQKKWVALWSGLRTSLYWLLYLANIDTNMSTVATA